MKTSYWKKTDTKILLDHPRVKVVEDDIILPDGRKTKYLHYEGLKSYVTLIAVRDGKIAMLREYSYPHDEWLWQFPEGSIEVGETSERAADRELAEEAGIAAKGWREIGMNYDHHRRTTVKAHVLVGEGIREVEKATGDPEEQGTEVHWFTREEVKKMVVGGDIVQKNALAALALYFMHSQSFLKLK